MGNVTMTARDTLHISNVRAENLSEGDVFNISDAEAKHLEDRGLADRGGAASKAVNGDAATASRPDSREEIDAERGFKEGRVISASKADPFNHDGRDGPGGSLKGSESTRAKGAARKGK